jgi:hypothetical protein
MARPGSEVPAAGRPGHALAMPVPGGASDRPLAAALDVCPGAAAWTGARSPALSQGPVSVMESTGCADPGEGGEGHHHGRARTPAALSGRSGFAGVEQKARPLTYDQAAEGIGAPGRRGNGRPHLRSATGCDGQARASFLALNPYGVARLDLDDRPDCGLELGDMPAG